ncbi:hypothetical protein C7U60_17860 [Mesorhizobium plurifarium]|uniref:hypothetical protein n=1 Tax=Sinorhizobium arboris TaxID=76745 RepID=UPI000485CB8F|nr:hypothetical protein [Sinorhizobium arboris]PST18697.1 hypothetical protein C7U60_17860 [Mesorhizobium plurifarium]
MTENRCGIKQGSPRRLIAASAGQQAGVEFVIEKAGVPLHAPGRHAQPKPRPEPINGGDSAGLSKVRAGFPKRCHAFFMFAC